jgi:hypothetical protein
MSSTYGDHFGDARRSIAYALTSLVDVASDDDRVAYAQARSRLAATLSGSLSGTLATDGLLTGPEAELVRALRVDLADVTLSGHRASAAGPVTAYGSRLVGHLTDAADSAERALHLARGHRDGDAVGPTRDGQHLAERIEGRALAADVADLAQGLAQVDTRVVAHMVGPRAAPAGPVARVAASLRSDSVRLQTSAAQAVGVLSGPRGGLDDLLPVPDLPEAGIDSPEQLADTVKTLVAWLRQHPGRLSAADLAALAEAGTRMCYLAKHAELYRPGGRHEDDSRVGEYAVNAVRYWRQLAARLAEMPDGRSQPRLAVAERITVFANRMLYGEYPGQARQVIASRPDAWRRSMGQVAAHMSDLARLLSAEAVAAHQRAPGVEVEGQRVQQAAAGPQFAPVEPVEGPASAVVTAAVSASMASWWVADAVGDAADVEAGGSRLEDLVMGHTRRNEYDPAGPHLYTVRWEDPKAPPNQGPRM